MLALSLSLQFAAQAESRAEPDGLRILRKAYPDAAFDASYDEGERDWKITVWRKESKKRTELFWADGRMLSRENLPRKDSYWPILYDYKKDLDDPADFTKEDVERIREWSAPESRAKQGGTSIDFFNAVYDCATRAETEARVKRTSFLGKAANAHEWMIPALKKVESKIYALAARDKEAKDFVDSLARADCYNWREIGDRNSRSFHSYGIAIDLLPKGWGQKNIYWAWRRDIDPENWMLLPLDRRWMPPKSVVEIFEGEGFIWGGKWTVWDNMHFEYHPELMAR